MIISKPRTNALFALTVFIIISLSLAYAGIQGPINNGVWKWYNYVAVYFFGPLSLVIGLRMLWNFKLVYFGKDRIEVKYPFRFSFRRYTLKEIESWSETQVKTGKSLFKELRIVFERRSIKLSNQENSSYKEVHNYLRKKAGKKEQRE